MKIKIKIGAFLLFFFLFIFKTTTNAATSVNLLQITTDGSQQSTPIIYKDKVIWTDWRNSATTDLDIFQYDVKTKIESPLIVKPGQQWAVGLTDNYVIYNQYVTGDPKAYDVRAYSLKTKKDTVITDDVGSQQATDVEGHTIVYLDGGACGKLYTYDLDRKKKKLITETACEPARIWDNIVAWNYAASNGTNVYGYNLNKKQQFDVATEDGFQESPDIHEDNVTWLHRLTGAYGDYNAIKVKNLKTGIVKTIYENSTDTLSNPVLSDNYVVWSQSSAQHIGGVRGANLKTGEVFEIQAQGSHQNSHTTPSIWKDTAVWSAWRTGNGDIYGSLLKNVKDTPTPIIGAALGKYNQPTGQACNINVPSQFSTIQAAINAAVNGNTICVGSGTYNEDVLINKSIRLSGKGTSKSFINGQSSTWPGAVYITAKNVIFEGFFIHGVGTNSTVQLDVNESPYNGTLQYNWMKAGDGGMALQLDGFQNTLVQNNILEGNNSPYVARESGGSSGRVDFLNSTFIGTVNPNDRSDTGITLDAGLPNGIIKQNVFNTTGTQISLIAPNGTSIINENNFNSNTTRKISNGWPTTVNAKNNWWGDLNPSDNIQGSVDYTPFATNPFAEN